MNFGLRANLPKLEGCTMDKEIIQNKYLRVTINPDEVKANVQLTDGDI